MSTIISKSSTPCEFCGRTIPAGTEIANETRKSWHLGCHKALTDARKNVPAAVGALRTLRLESEAVAMQDATEKAALIFEACDAADKALDGLKAGGAAHTEARAAVKAYRDSVPASIAGAGAHNERAAALISGHVNKIRKGE
jgi:hypothetical protein